MMTKPNLEDRNEIIVKLRGWVLHFDHTQKKKKFMNQNGLILSYAR